MHYQRIPGALPENPVLFLDYWFVTTKLRKLGLNCEIFSSNSGHSFISTLMVEIKTEPSSPRNPLCLLPMADLDVRDAGWNWQWGLPCYPPTPLKEPWVKFLRTHIFLKSTPTTKMSSKHPNLYPKINRKSHNGNWKRTFFLEPALLFLHNSHPSFGTLLEVVLS